MNKQKQEINEIEINDLFLKTYNRIAKWHNEDGTSQGLKTIVHYILDDSAEKFLGFFDLKHDMKISMDEETRKKVEEAKRQLNDEKI
jgi:hypothetical protein